MKPLRAIAAALVLFFAAACPAAAQVDSIRLKSMDLLLEQCYQSFRYYDIAEKAQLCDLFISDVSDPHLRQYAAVSMYNHYMSSKLMGDEGVSVHLYDKWFATKLLAMPSELDLMNAGIYAEFNRRSLLGCNAPVLTLQDTSGVSHTIPGKGSVNVLFFYDTTCSKCKLETMLLSYVLKEASDPFNFYAIYVGDDPKAWEEFRKERFNFEPGKAAIHHLWDPDMSSDFQRAYGVLQTPVMVLAGCDGKIMGRKLNSDALSKLLPSAFFEQVLYNKCLPGTMVPDFTFNGKLISKPRGLAKLLRRTASDGTISKEGSFNTLKLKGRPAYLVFHLTHCSDCKAELKALQEALDAGEFEPGTRFLLVDVDEAVASWPQDQAQRLFDSFDLTFFPYILKLDSKGKILDRRCSFIKK